MTDLDALLQSVVINPAEDTPRLMLADWYDENDQPARAEFVRKQIELARTPNKLPPGQIVYSPGGVILGITNNPTTNPQWQALRGRCEQLFDREWLPDFHPQTLRAWHLFKPVTGMAPGVQFGYFVNRGFVGQVCCTAENWLEHADSLHWHPEQRDKCPNCEGRGETRFCDTAGDMDDEPCPDCGGKLDGGYKRGSGTRPRPFPVTAQPITAVTLTTRPEVEFRDYQRGARRDVCRLAGRTWRPTPTGDVEAGLLAAEWPRITFTIPEPDRGGIDIDGPWVLTGVGGRIGMEDTGPIAGENAEQINQLSEEIRRAEENLLNYLRTSARQTALEIQNEQLYRNHIAALRNERSNVIRRSASGQQPDWFRPQRQNDWRPGD